MAETANLKQGDHVTHLTNDKVVWAYVASQIRGQEKMAMIERIDANGELKQILLALSA